MMGVIETIRFLGAINGIIATKDMDAVSKLSVLVGRWPLSHSRLRFLSMFSDVCHCSHCSY